MKASRQSSGWRASALALAISILSAGCAGRRVSQQSESDANTISFSEIEAAHAATAYDAIRKLRPQFLTGRGQLTLDPRRTQNAAAALPRVYVDDQFYGDASTLRGIVTGSIETIHFYSGSAAQYKYGHDNATGVIAIVTKH